MADLAHPDLPAEDPRNDTPAERAHKWKVLAVGVIIFLALLGGVIARSGAF